MTEPLLLNNHSINRHAKLLLTRIDPRSWFYIGDMNHVPQSAEDTYFLRLQGRTYLLFLMLMGVLQSNPHRPRYIKSAWNWILEMLRQEHFPRSYWTYSLRLKADDLCFVFINKGNVTIWLHCQIPETFRSKHVFDYNANILPFLSLLSSVLPSKN